MSNWTHIEGVIRLDWMGFIFGESFDQKKLEAILGTPCGYENRADYSPGKAGLPLGSEGSLRWKLVVTKDTPNDLAFGLIYIWGDLRDYDNVEEVHTWLNTFVEHGLAELDIRIRNGVVEVDVAFSTEQVVFLFQEGDEDEFGQFTKLVLTKK